MNDLLDYVLDAHGGLNRWSGVSTLTAKFASGGPFWKLRGFPGAFGDETLTIDVRRQHAVVTPWTAPGRTVTFGTGPERVTLHDSSGQIIASLADPRSSYAKMGVSCLSWSGGSPGCRPPGVADGSQGEQDSQTRNHRSQTPTCQRNAVRSTPPGRWMTPASTRAPASTLRPP